MARRYIMDAVLESIEERPIFSTSKDIKDAVNRKIQKNGWNRNINTVQIGQIARLLVDERAIFSRRKKGKDRIQEYISLTTLRRLT